MEGHCTKSEGWNFLRLMLGITSVYIKDHFLDLIMFIYFKSMFDIVSSILKQIKGNKVLWNNDFNRFPLSLRSQWQGAWKGVSNELKSTSVHYSGHQNVPVRFQGASDIHTFSS